MRLFGELKSTIRGFYSIVVRSGIGVSSIQYQPVSLHKGRVPTENVEMGKFIKPVVRLQRIILKCLSNNKGA